MSAITARLAASEALVNWTRRSAESRRASDSCSNARLTSQLATAMTQTAMMPTQQPAIARARRDPADPGTLTTRRLSMAENSTRTWLHCHDPTGLIDQGMCAA